MGVEARGAGAERGSKHGHEEGSQDGQNRAQVKPRNRLKSLGRNVFSVPQKPLGFTGDRGQNFGLAWSKTLSRTPCVWPGRSFVAILSALMSFSTAAKDFEARRGWNVGRGRRCALAFSANRTWPERSL